MCKPRWAILLLAPLLAAVGPAGAATQDAEFAVRWDPRQGGPATPQDALRELRLKASAPSHFEVQYFEFAAPAGLPTGFDPILRKRLTGGEAELTFKLRGLAPLPAQPSLKRWDCPLGPTQERKDEADITFVAAGRTVTAYSRSCSLESRQADLQPPAALQARPKGCGSTMTRLRSGKLKVEAWTMGDGSVLLEASRPGKHDEASMRAFERQVLQPLLALKVQPLERSKSAIGGDCAR
ncbi:MAG: hypothetical protein MUF08_05880 [Burkholderiaceae bacterium]|jgi:hypothetical protein|nr:hypothetical protein [Burkholderiaceae bacterium]